MGHLVEWFPGFLHAGAGVELPKGPPVAEDPVAAWAVHSDGVQALLDDPATAGKVLSNPNIGEMPLDHAVAMFYTSDVFMYTGPGAGDRPGRTPGPAAVRRDAGGHAADGHGAAVQRALRPEGRGPRRRRSADPPARLHRPHSLMGEPMSANRRTVETYLDGFRRNDHAQILSCLTDGTTMRMSMAEVFVMRDGLIAERRAWVIELKENDHR